MMVMTMTKTMTMMMMRKLTGWQCDNFRRHRYLLFMRTEFDNGDGIYAVVGDVDEES